MGNFNKFGNSIFYVLASEAAVIFIGGAIYLYSYQSIGNQGLAILVSLVATLLLGAAVWYFFSIMWDIEPRKKKQQMQAEAERKARQEAEDKQRAIDNEERRLRIEEQKLELMAAHPQQEVQPLTPVVTPVINPSPVNILVQQGVAVTVPVQEVVAAPSEAKEEPQPEAKATAPVQEEAEVSPEEDDAPKIPEGFPDALATKQVLAFMELFKEQGILDENYKPYGNYSKTQLVYLIDAMNDIVPISKRWALFGKYWEIEGKLADISSDIRNNGTKVTDQSTLDKIIVRIDEYIPSMKYVNTFTSWKRLHGFADRK